MPRHTDTIELSCVNLWELLTDKQDKAQQSPESPFSISKFRNRMKLDMINCLCLFIAVPVLVTKHTETVIWG